MTTTLRPTGPERRTDDGGRSRAYDVCVNSRPVGRIDLATDHRFGPSVGRIERLEVDPADRHRGRGTVAALAAEEVLRGWGCERIEAGVPAGATTALGLAGALGYSERGRNMIKHLGQSPELPAGSTARRLSDTEYPAWLAHEREGYVQEWTARGVPEEQARAKADNDYAQLLPQGPATPGACLRILAHDGTDVGTIWVALHNPRGDQGEAYVYSVEVAEEHRGRGHGRTLMLVAERECLAAGVRDLGLHVFAGSTTALRLYESLGYRPTRFNLFKQLV
ncbi:GNAT family N-acetyltransferase [Streptomyces sp. P1-3]|uniref:GNAT family N-acetyltransferase n=1 Tax=Streptomyces sp. P1-3 TaxID=3421658 RepID=UPI003D35C6B1